MKSFTLLVPDDGGQPVLIREGFSWGAFLFGPFWLLWNGLWLSALALIAVSAGVFSALAAADAAAVAAPPAMLAACLIIGFSARDWQRYRLTSGGFRLAEIVLARNSDEAERAMLNRAFGSSRVS